MEKTKTMLKFRFSHWLWIVLHPRQVYWSNVVENIGGAIDGRMAQKLLPPEKK